MENTDDSNFGYYPQPGSQETALNCDADVVVYGGAAGAGKSYLGLLRGLLGVEDSNFKAVYFRRTGPQLSGAGGLWDEAKTLFQPWTPRLIENERIAKFKNGAHIKFSHMEHVKNKLDH